MTDRGKAWVERLFGLVGIGFICLIVGVIFDYRPLIVAGGIGMILLALLLVIAVLGYIWDGLDRALPQFKGKSLIIAVVLLLVGAAFAIGGLSGQSEQPCKAYRGSPTC